jgi:outer membrane immunogenic protein
MLMVNEWEYPEMKKLVIALAIVSAASSTSAFAADLVPVEPASFDWSGFYLGGHAGIAWADYESEQTGDGDVAADPPDLFDYPGGTDTGFFGGVQAGYNIQMQSIVFGLEGDLGGIAISDNSRDTQGPIAYEDTSVDYGLYGVIAGRLGFAVDRSLFYAKGGLAIADIKNRSYEFSDGIIENDEDHRNKGTQVGWTLGGGFEYAFNDNWSGKIEYLHMDFGSDSVKNLEGDTIEFRNHVDTLKVGINYQF